MEQDRIAGKKTLGVLWGSAALQWEYILMGLVSLFIPIFLYVENPFGTWILLPLLTLPIGFFLTRTIWTVKDKTKLNRTLEHTGQWMTLYGILFTLGIVLG
jgi:1,4-dihydroxy-2-naphthoate octaprenyltransferase